MKGYNLSKRGCFVKKRYINFAEGKINASFLHKNNHLTYVITLQRTYQQPYTLVGEGDRMPYFDLRDQTSIPPTDYLIHSKLYIELDRQER